MFPASEQPQALLCPRPMKTHPGTNQSRNQQRFNVQYAGKGQSPITHFKRKPVLFCGLCGWLGYLVLQLVSALEARELNPLAWAPENSTMLPFRQPKVTRTSPGKLGEWQLCVSHHSHCHCRHVQRRPLASLCLFALCQAQGLQLASLRRGLGTTLGTESTVKMQSLWQMEQGV